MQDMQIRINFSYMMSDYIGIENGVSQQEIDSLEERIQQAHDALFEARDQMAWRHLPYNQDDVVDEILLEASQIKEKFDAFVVFGVGGSALGPRAVHEALNHIHYNALPKEARGGCPRIYIEDNVDPECMQALLDIIDVEKTCFNFISKSGNTSETVTQFLIIVDMLRSKMGEDWSKNIIITTGDNDGSFIQIAKQYNIKTFYVPDGVGGRFSELCPVGLLPAAVCGIDIKSLLQGAAHMDTLCEKPDVWQNPAYMLATLQYIMIQKGKNISIMMPYADALDNISDWYAQLWAESLGKRYDRQGNEIFCGQIPVKAVGVTDQHSQMQLYTEGPFDKVITFLSVDRYQGTMNIPNAFPDYPNMSFLGEHTLNELIRAELYATQYALYQSQRPTNVIILPEVNAFTIGQLIYLFEMQTAFIGELLDINVFNQPGVEAGKQATYALLGKKGYEQKREEMSRKLPHNPRYTF